MDPRDKVKASNKLSVTSFSQEEEVSVTFKAAVHANVHRWNEPRSLACSIIYEVNKDSGCWRETTLHNSHHGYR